MRRACHIEARCGQGAGVRVVKSGDVPGLVAEGQSPNLLAAKLRVLVSEFLGLDRSVAPGMEPVGFVVRYQHKESGITLP